ncbi:MAG: ABC transporter substrate-binding protein [Candidatus Velthaea sp.]
MTLTRRALLAAIAAAAAAPLTARAADATKLQLASSLEDDIAPVLYGRQAGIFARLNLDVSVQPVTSGAAAAAAVAGRAVDIAKSSLMALIAAHARGIPISIIAPGSYYTSTDPVAALIVAKNSPIRSASDLNGKAIAGSSLKDVKSVSAAAWMDTHGGDSKSVKFVEVPTDAIVPALEAGRIDAATVLNPTLDQAVSSGKARALANVFDAIARRFLITAWFANTEYVERNRDVVQRFVEGLRQASVYANAHNAEMVPVLAPFLHQEPAMLRKLRRTPLATSLDPREIQPVIDAAAKYGVIASAYPAESLIANAPKPA